MPILLPAPTRQHTAAELPGGRTTGLQYVMNTSHTKTEQVKSPDTRRLENLVGRAFESLPVALVVFDRQMKILARNRSASALLPDGADLSEALGRLTVDGRFEDWAVELRRVLDSRLPRRIDVNVKNDQSVDGGTANPPTTSSETYLNLLIHPLEGDAPGEIIGGILMAEDVTAGISMQRRLAVSERLAAVGKLAARVAHELNNPLDGVLRFTNLAIRRLAKLTSEAGTATDEKLIGYLENARAAIVRMSAITGDLLEFSRSTPSTFEQATINRIVEDALHAMEGRAHDARITIVCNFCEQDMPVVRGSNLFQIFCNLIKNAVESMPEGGTLTVATRMEPQDVIVTIADTGVGLPENAERIFEPFFTTKPSGQGTGLGLAVCKDLIEKYAGKITPSRNAPRGTVMTVQIPIRNCAATPSAGAVHVTGRRHP